MRSSTCGLNTLTVFGGSMVTRITALKATNFVNIKFQFYIMVAVMLSVINKWGAIALIPQKI